MMEVLPMVSIEKPPSSAPINDVKVDKFAKKSEEN